MFRKKKIQSIQKVHTNTKGIEKFESSRFPSAPLQLQCLRGASLLVVYVIPFLYSGSEDPMDVGFKFGTHHCIHFFSLKITSISKEDNEEDKSPIQAIKPRPCLSFGPERKASVREEDSRPRGTE